ncbi:hypothetical protein K9N50_06930 [bacterium]|nr:hypothetical protein [bacterium]
MAGYENTGYKELSRQAALILGLAVFTWCTIKGMEFIDALFKALVVYLVLSTITSVLSRLLRKMTDEVLSETDDEELKKNDKSSEDITTNKKKKLNPVQDNSE